MSKNNELRPQAVKTPKQVEVKVALPWTIIIVLAALLAGFVGGWSARSNVTLTNAEVRAEVLTQLAAKK